MTTHTATRAGPAFASGSADAAGGLDPAARSGYPATFPGWGFSTDTPVCIGWKACEVACKEWNAVPEDGLTLTGMSYDNTASLGASTWRPCAPRTLREARETFRYHNLQRRVVMADAARGHSAATLYERSGVGKGDH